jgi:hypothetical protein
MHESMKEADPRQKLFESRSLSRVAESIAEMKGRTGNTTHEDPQSIY